MTKDKKTARMSMISDKRRGTSSATSTGTGTASASHVLRTTSSTPSQTQNQRNSIIAAPPRAQLTGPSSSSSSPGPEDAGHEGTGGGGAPLAKQDGGSTGTSTIIGSGSSPASVKEKDQRIANLERELALMETEFQRELDKLSQNESETATFWQTKHSALNQQFLRTDTELRLLRAEVELREGEREELREGWEVLRRELREKDAEIKELRAQVRGLKEWVSTSTRTDGQTSDEVFGDGMARLGNGLQNWVIVHFRRAKLDVSKADGHVLQELQQLVPMYEELALTAKVHLLQSLVSRILVHDILDSYFVGLSREQTSQFHDMEQVLLSYSSPEAVNQWRSSTLTLLSRDVNQTMQASITATADNTVRRINRLLDAITDATGSEARDAALRVLVNSSVELARLLVVQKAVLKFSMPEILPHQRTTFDPTTMEDIGGEDEDSLAEREICCITFPGIIKRGDENGGHLQFQNVIAKARVLCSPE